MSTFQHLETQCNCITDSQTKFNEALLQLEEHRNALKQKARDKVEEWKRMLDESLKLVNLDIDKKFLPYEGEITDQIKEFDSIFTEGQLQQTVIREILDSTTDKIRLNPSYVAYEIMENDPLNEQSVEYLSSHQQVWLDNSKKKIASQESAINTVQRQYSDIHIGFSQLNFEKHLKRYYMLKDLSEYD